PGAGDENLGAEPARLLAGPLGEVRAADAFGKTQIILDFRTAAGLSTDRIAFYYNGFQPLRSAIDSRAEPRRPGPIDRQVVLFSRGILVPAEFFQDLSNRGALDACPIGEFTDRQPLIFNPRDL